MSYETLDAIADAYIPFLLILLMLGLVIKIYQFWPNFRAPVFFFLYLMSLLLVSYSLMFLDKAVGLWPALGLDYSTHTAVALSLVVALCKIFPHRWKWFAGSMVLYGCLMLYQQYHSLLDIISTSAIIAVIAFLLHRMIEVPKYIKNLK